MKEKSERLGYLRSCMDRRFMDEVRMVFEEKTGLSATQYWHESYPGGSALPTDETGEQYVSKHGVSVWGWAAHGSGCGGQPGVSDGEITVRLTEVINQKKEKYPGDHYKIFSTDAGTTIEKIE